MPTFPWSIYMFLVPCVFQIFLNFLELKRTKYWGKIVWICAFTFLSIGLALLIVVADLPFGSDRDHFVQIYRWSLVIGAVLWFIDQLLWLRLRIKVV